MIRRPKRKTKYARRKRNIPYMLWIKTHPCICCGSRRMIEAAHVGDRAFGQKCPDDETVPLCIEDHTQGKRSHHKMGRSFWVFWCIDRDKLIADFKEKYRREYGETETKENSECRSAELDQEAEADQADGQE